MPRSMGNPAMNKDRAILAHLLILAGAEPADFVSPFSSLSEKGPGFTAPASPSESGGVHE
jgi:hypothetical protein